MFREMDGLTKMVSFIGNPEYASLHVFAVIVLSNCLEDLESVEVRYACCVLKINYLYVIFVK